MMYENGSRIVESERYRYSSHMITGEIDLDRIVQDRMRTNTLRPVDRRATRMSSLSFARLRFRSSCRAPPSLRCERRYERFPYVPSDPATRDVRCHEVYEIQVQGLVKRLRAMKTDKVVIGISGGLDSTQALIVCARAMDVMGLPRTNILAYTMPGFATSGRTLDQSRRLMEAVGCTAHEMDIRPSCLQMLKDIGHPFADGKPVYDVTFENVQAGERTSHLFRLANVHNAPVVGTSDLSELALGWCTYGVGDHMAHYHVNASVPKTLIQYLIRYVARTNQLGPEVSAVLLDVLDTPISPELVPGQERDGAGTEYRGGGRALRAAGFSPLLHPAVRLSADQGGVHGVVHLARSRVKATGRRFPATDATSTTSLRSEVAGDLRAALLPVLAVQAQRDAERAQGGFGRLAVAAQRLSCAERQRSDRLAGGRGAHPDPRAVMRARVAALCDQRSAQPAGCRTRWTHEGSAGAAVLATDDELGAVQVRDRHLLRNDRSCARC